MICGLSASANTGHIVAPSSVVEKCVKKIMSKRMVSRNTVRIGINRSMSAWRVELEDGGIGALDSSIQISH